MPWKVSDVDSHKKGLSPEQKKKWVSIANSTLAACKSNGETDCDGKAIRIASSQVGGHADNAEIVKFNYTPKSLQDIETMETENGLLVKEVPVFRAGTHRGKKFDEDFIDNILIKKFDKNPNTPVQADHSESYKDTLGYVKRLTRKGKMLYADMHLLADNAITRWRKGLMKKWSVGIYVDERGLREISAVAFPYVKEASVLSEDENIKDYVVTEKQVSPEMKREIIEIEAEDLRNGKDKTTITYETVDGDTLPASDSKIVKNQFKDNHRDNSSSKEDVNKNNKKAIADNAVDAEVKTHMEGEDMDEKKIDELAELKATQLLKEANEKEEKLNSDIEAKNKELEDERAESTKLKEEKAELEKTLDASEVRATVASFKEEGKVLPAEEEKVVSFMLGLSKEQREKYAEMLKSADKKVDLTEKGNQKTEKVDEEEAKYKIDLDEATSEELEALVDKYAEDKGVPVDDARDIIYDKNQKKEKE